MKTDPRQRYLKKSLKQCISSILGVSLLSFPAVLFAQDQASSSPVNTSQASQKESQKSPISAPISATPAPKESTPRYAPSYGTQFCLFAALRPRLAYYEVSIFSSFRSGGCSLADYEKLTEASIRAQLKTYLDPNRVLKLGFHTNVASENLTPRIFPYFSVGVPKFDYVSKVEINYVDYIFQYVTNERFRLGVAQASYVPMANIAPLHYIYNPGSTVYELTAPGGAVYIMTSFSTLFNNKLTLTNLSELSTLLTLPPGWKFRSRVIDQIISIDATAPYYYSDVIFDNYQNFYVQVRQ